SRILLVDGDPGQLFGARTLALEAVRHSRPVRLHIQIESQITRDATADKPAWHLPAQKMIDASERPHGISEARTPRPKRAGNGDRDLPRVARRFCRVLVCRARHKLHSFAIGAA